MLLASQPLSASALPLPDGRVYEQVSPAQKSGGIGGVFPLGSLTHSLEQFGRPLQSSLDGSRITYLGEDFYHPQLGSLNQYLSRRGPSGWSTQNLTPGVPATTESAIEANLADGFSADLSVGVFAGLAPLALPGIGGYADISIARDSNLEPLLSGKPPNRLPDTFGYANQIGQPIERILRFAGSNSGSGSSLPYSHVLFEANDALTQEATDGGELANNLYEWADHRLSLVNILPHGEADPNATFGVNNNDIYNTSVVPSMSHVISADGTRIFWTDENTHNLYVREDATRTVEVDSAAGGGGQFQTASADGSKVLFMKAGDLYLFSTSNETTNKIVSGGVLGILGASDDLTYVYLVATDALTTGAIAGQPNLYVYHEGALSLVATLAPVDDEVPLFYGTTVSYGDWYRTFAGHTARVSPNGRYVTFVSVASLTGYDNADIHALGRDYEVFLYDSLTGTLACASCNTDRSRPTSSTILPAPVNGVYQQDYLNNEGRLFFSTADAVLPQDTNGTSDVYEYEGGHVYLISPGNAADEAVFADASESGNDVFFTTRQQLVPADRDRILDLYDADVGGRREELPSPPCAGEECRGTPTSLASLEVPLSAIFTGGGNLLGSQSPRAKQPIHKKAKKAKAKPGRRRAKTHHGNVKKQGARAKKGARR
jgi:hypothetical protein